MRNKILRFTRYAINLVIFFEAVTVLACVGGTIAILFCGYKIERPTDIVYVLIKSGICLVVFCEFKKIIKDVIKKDVFTQINVKRFNIIGILIFLEGIIRVILRTNRANNFELFAYNQHSIDGTVIINIAIAGLALIMADIFKEALDIKKENELTI